MSRVQAETREETARRLDRPINDIVPAPRDHCNWLINGLLGRRALDQQSPATSDWKLSVLHTRLRRWREPVSPCLSIIVRVFARAFAILVALSFGIVRQATRNHVPTAYINIRVAQLIINIPRIGRYKSPRFVFIRMAGETRRAGGKIIRAQPDESIAGEPARPDPGCCWLWFFLLVSIVVNRSFSPRGIPRGSARRRRFSARRAFYRSEGSTSRYARESDSRYNAKRDCRLLFNGPAAVVIKLVSYRWNSRRAVVKFVEAARFITPSRGESSFYINCSFYMTLDPTFSNLASNNPDQPPWLFLFVFPLLLPLSFFR